MFRLLAMIVLVLAVGCADREAEYRAIQSQVQACQLELDRIESRSSQLINTGANVNNSQEIRDIARQSIDLKDKLEILQIKLENVKRRL